MVRILAGFTGVLLQHSRCAGRGIVRGRMTPVILDELLGNRKRGEAERAAGVIAQLYR